MGEINFKNKIIPYTITKKANKKNVSLYVKYPDKVSVVAPLNSDNQLIHEFVCSKSSWVYDKLMAYEKIQANSSDITFEDKSTISYMGNDYELNLMKSTSNNTVLPSLEIKDNKFIIEYKDQIDKEEIK